MAKIKKITPLTFAKRNIKKQPTLRELNDKSNRADNLRVLYNYSILWDKLRAKRERNIRCYNFLIGNQWCDIIYDEDNKKYVTEEEYLRSRGKYPKVRNIIRPLVKRIVGEYSSSDAEVIIMSRRKTDEGIEDLLSNAIQSVHTINKTKLLDAKLLENFLTTGEALMRIQYGYNEELDESDIKYIPLDVNRFFFNSDIVDFRLEDVKIVGYMHDYSIDECINNFAKSEDDEEYIREIYKYTDKKANEYLIDMYNNILPNVEHKDIVMDFHLPKNYYCRVIEIWEKRAKWEYHIIDEANAVDETADGVDLEEVARINKERLEVGKKNGMKEDEIPLIIINKIRKFYWHGTYYSPYGDVLWDGKSPYFHGEHPFVFYAYPIINGVIYSFVDDLIPLNKSINRNVSLLDSIIAASAKGAVFVPIQIVPEDVSREEFSKSYSDTNTIMYYVYKPGIPLPTAISNNNTNIGAYEALSRDLQMMHQISGVYEAMVGQAPPTNTPAALYAQQSANSSLNVVDYLNAFEYFLELRDRKTLKMILQYYSKEKFMFIRGNDDKIKYVKFDKENIKKTDYVLVRRKSQLAPAYKLLFEDRLFQLAQTGMIDPQIYLSLSSMPYASKILEMMQQKQQMNAMQMQLLQQMQMAAQQGQQQEQQQQQQQMPQDEFPFSQ